MGCDCHIYLPPNVRIKDVVDVLGILIGKPKKKMMLGDDKDSWSVHAEGVNIEHGQSTPEMMVITATLPDGPAKKARGQQGEKIMAYWHWESSRKPGWRLFSVRATAFWITIGKNLVDFFGGVVDFNDCDDNDADYKRHAKPHRMNCPEDGDAWQRFQKRKWKVKALADKDFEYDEKFAVYKVKE